MADNIVDITFTNVQMNDGTATHTGSFSPTTLQIDYSTSPLTVTILSGGPLTFSANDGSTLPGITNNTVMFSSFSLVQPFPGFYLLTATASQLGNPDAHIAMSWNGFSPSAFGSSDVAVGGSISPPVPPTFNYSHFVSNTITSVFPCFAAGTLIRTPAGDVPVETLEIGDLVVTASGEHRPVKWIGHRDLDLRRHPDPLLVFPVRIAAEAFGPNRPSQDLYLSSGHSVCVDLVGEVFIPAGHLVNGATIARVEVDEVSYWHVELDSHDILLANNLPAESYMAMGNRSFFAERRGLLPAIDEGRERTHADFCRPVVLDGPVLAFARERLLTRAEALGWTPSIETDLHLVVDGEVRRPLSEGGAAVFLFPASARDVRLKSNTFIPALLGGGDPRPLGVSLTGLVFLGGRADVRPVDLDDGRLRDGLHPGEAESGVAWRWTNGELVLSPDFWQGLSGCVALHVTGDNIATRRWIAPVKAPAEVRSLRSAQTQLHVA
jgi:Hint domain